MYNEFIESILFKGGQTNMELNLVEKSETKKADT